MTRDKQLRRINIRALRLKRDADQALNAKEFAVLAGISYSVAREWFHLTGFPSVRGMVFWKDFVLWRRTQNPAKATRASDAPHRDASSPSMPSTSGSQWPARAASILSAVQ